MGLQTQSEAIKTFTVILKFLLQLWAKLAESVLTQFTQVDIQRACCHDECYHFHHPANTSWLFKKCASSFCIYQHLYCNFIRTIDYWHHVAWLLENKVAFSCYKLHSKMITLAGSLLASIVFPVFYLYKNKAFKRTFHPGTLYSVPGSKPSLTLILTCDVVSRSSPPLFFSLATLSAFPLVLTALTALTPPVSPSVRLAANQPPLSLWAAASHSSAIFHWQAFVFIFCS